MTSRSNSNDPLLLAACATAFASLIPSALRQTGVIGNLPDPLVDANKIVESPVAHPFGVPASLLGLASFSITFGLALAAQNSSLARKLLGGKIAIDCTIAAYDLALEAVAFGELSSWSLGTAAATGVMAYAAHKPVVEALRIAAHDATVMVNTI